MSESSNHTANYDEAEFVDAMLVMDVVDTLRHSKAFTIAQMKADVNRDDIMAQLRNIYAAQGLELSDDVLTTGITAFQKDVTAFTPPRSGPGLWMAGIYTSRKKWLPFLYTLIFLLGLVSAVNYFGYVRPAEVEAQRQEQMAIDAEAARVQREIDAKREAIEAEERRVREAAEAKRAAEEAEKRAIVDAIERKRQLTEVLPPELKTLYDEILKTAKTDKLKTRAKLLYDDGRAAIVRKDVEAAKASVEALNSYLYELRQRYEVRIVSRPGEYSGVFRNNYDGDVPVKNFYLIVEGINRSGNKVPVDITSEEDQETRRVRIWGVRVPEDVFNVVAADKRDDQIIQNSIIGEKKVGFLAPDYNIDASGGFILEW